MKSIKEFLDLYPKKNTQDVYKAGIYTFLEFFYPEIKRKGRQATKDEVIRFEKAIKRYIDEKNGDLEAYLDDLMRFAAYLHSKPPKTAKSYLGAMKEYLGYNNIEFTQRQLKTIRFKLPKGGVRTIEHDMETTTLQRILQHTDLKGKALILTLASSGMRIGEALQITLDDINLDSTPPIITIRGEYTKTGEHRFAFLSREAKETLNEWLKVRNQYLKVAKNKNRGLISNGAKPKTLSDNRVFPFTDNNAFEIWSNTLSNAGLLSIDRGTNRKQLRIHQLRKFFRSQLALGCPVDIVEALMGHEGYLTGAYRRYTKEEKARNYLKNEHYITVFNNQSVEQIKKDIVKETNEEVEALKSKNQVLELKVQELANVITRQDLQKPIQVIEDPSGLFKKEIQKITSEKIDISNKRYEMDMLRSEVDAMYQQNQMLQKEMQSMKNFMQKLINAIPGDIIGKVAEEVK